MPKRTILWLPILAILVAAGSLTAGSSHAEPAADDCIARPSSAPPQGSHWYYRVDRTTKRSCWYLGPVGGKVLRAASPKRSPSPAINLSQAQREVLFQEYVKWQKQRDSVQR